MKPFELLYRNAVNKQVKPSIRSLSDAETEVAILYFKKWCEMNALDFNTAPAIVFKVYIGGFVNGVTYAGGDLHSMIKAWGEPPSE